MCDKLLRVFRPAENAVHLLVQVVGSSHGEPPMTPKEYDDRRSALTKAIREAMQEQQIAADSGNRAGDLEAQARSAI